MVASNFGFDRWAVDAALDILEIDAVFVGYFAIVNFDCCGGIVTGKECHSVDRCHRQNGLFRLFRGF